MPCILAVKLVEAGAASGQELNIMHKFSYSPAPLKKVKHVQWGLFSPEEIVCYQNSSLN